MMHSWTDKPLLKTKASGESRASMTVTVVPQNIVADAIEAHSNNLADKAGRRLLPLDMAGAKLDRPAERGFHWLARARNRAIRCASHPPCITSASAGQKIRRICS